MVDDHAIAFADHLPELPRTMEAFLAAGATALRAADDIVVAAPASYRTRDYQLRPPLRRPQKILGIAYNYRSHAAEVSALAPPPVGAGQIWFNKQVSSITGPRDCVFLPPESEQLDFEVELALVIGTRCRRIAPEHARDVVAGYMIINDLSVRDWQFRSPTAMLGKSFDTHAPIGPWITTPDEVENPDALGLKTYVDGVLMQEGNTRDWVNGIGEMLAYLSKVMTLEPGDIIATGTPPGVALSRAPPNWLRAGQRVRCEIEGLGYLENMVVAEARHAQ